MARDSEQDAAILRLALTRFQLAADAEVEQRRRELEDLTFEFDPWPDEAKKARAGYQYAGEVVPARPMLNIPMLDQPLQLVINQEKAAHLGINVHPETEGADEETAEVLQGLIRHIETRSRAGLARSWAFERAIRCGRGYYEVQKRLMQPDAEGPEGKDQELVITRILNQFSVYDDPFAQEPDFSDRLFAFKVVDLDWQRYRLEFAGSKLAELGPREGAAEERLINQGAVFTSQGDQPAVWVTDNYARIAEYWAVDVDEQAKTRTVTWRKINGVEVLDEVEWDGTYIPLIFVAGREYNVGGQRLWNGVIGPAKDSARLVNYTASTIAEKVAIDAKTPWILAEGQEEGHEAEFVRASVRPVPYVRYKPTTVQGQVIGPPVRNASGPDIQADVALLQTAKDFVHTSTFTFDPSLGNVSPRDRSGKAILAQQQQSDSSNSHYLDNLAELSMTYEAKVLLDLIPKVYDRPGRRQELIDSKDQRRKVLLNHPFMAHPQTKHPIPVTTGPQGQQTMPAPPPPKGQPAWPPQPVPPGTPIQHVDLTQGRYGTTVSIGKSYQSKMQAGSDQLGALIQTDPAVLFPVLGWRWMQYNDAIPGHEEIADDLKKIRPPALQDDQGQHDPQVLQQKLQQLGQQHDQLVQALQQAQQVIQTKQIEQQGKVQVSQEEGKAKVAIAQLDRDAKIVVAAISAKVSNQQVILEAVQSANELLAEQQAQGHDQAHAVALAAMQHQQALQQAAQANQHQMAQNDQQSQHAMVQTQQQADLAPPPPSPPGDQAPPDTGGPNA